jgi:PAS domain S-box-containing protein
MSSSEDTSPGSADKVESRSEPDIEAELSDLRLRLSEAEDTLRALQGGDVDAIVVGGYVYTLGAADAASNRLRGDALAQMEDAIVAADAQLRVIYLNPAAERQYKMRGSDILGRKVEQLYREEWLSEADREACSLALAEGGFWRGQMRHVLSNGESVQLECTLNWLHDDAGARTGYLAVMRDVSPRIKAEAALKESQSRLQFSLQSAKIGDWSVELQTGNATGSSLYFSILGIEIPPVDWSWRSALSMVHPDERMAVDGAFQSAINRRSEFHIEYRIVRSDGTVRWVDMHASVLLSIGRGDRMVGILADITPRKLAEQALRDADRKKDEFLATLAHELRNPLAPIRNAAHVLSHAAVDEKTLRKSAAIVQRQVSHMARLLDDLLDVARITRGQLALKKEYVSVQSLVSAAIETARPAIDAKRHRLEVVMPDEPMWIEADPVRVAQVISNLLNNAAKYSDTGAEIAVRLSRGETDTAFLTVRDTGIGMSPVALKSVFQMFAQEDTALDRSEGGLGIGLALVKGLVELHGGTVEATSAGVGCGSEFAVRLPLSEHLPPTQASVNTASPEVSGRRIVIADDNRDAAASLVTLLEMQGYDVTAVHDGLEAFDVARALRPKVMLLDIGMPGLNGYELVKKLRLEAWGKDIVLIASTGWGQDEDRMRAFACGFDAHLTKPFDPEELFRLLSRDFEKADH